MPVLNGEESNQIDRKAIENWGMPSEVLMENAGRSFVQLLSKQNSQIPHKVVVLAGTGNNGGDGLVIARWLINRGKSVQVLVVGSESGLSPTTRANARILQNYNAEVSFSENLSKSLDQKSFAHHDLLVDALIGVGISGPVRGEYRRIIKQVNGSNITVASVDLPSGLPADSGNPPGVCIKADLTITMGFPKIGSLLPPGPEYVGNLQVASVGYPKPLLNEFDKIRRLVNPDWVSDHLLSRSDYSHKGNFGRLVVMAGSTGLTGAGMLTARSAQRTGVGLCYLAVPRSLNSIFEQALPEVITKPLPDEGSGSVSRQALDPLVDLVEDKAGLAIGPGLSQSDQIRQIVPSLLRQVKLPKVIDADGINAFSGQEDKLKQVDRAIITPHPGELARLLDTSASDINKHRIEIASQVAQDFEVILVLKGVPTVIAEPAGSQFIVNCPTSGLAKGGSGDVLTGMIGGLMAQGQTLLESACIAAYIHCQAAQRAVEESGPRSTIPGNIVNYIGPAFEELNTND